MNLSRILNEPLTAGVAFMARLHWLNRRVISHAMASRKKILVPALYVLK